MKAVFFDRDGVLNSAEVKDGKPYPPKNAKALHITPNAPTLLARLKRNGFILICITNQPDYARGTRTLENISAMNEKILSSLPLDDLFCCLHDDKDNCACRKPKAGMLFEAAKKWSLDLKKSYTIGDRANDIKAGINAGTKTIFIDQNYKEEKPQFCDFVCKNLTQAVEYILRGENVQP